MTHLLPHIQFVNQVQTRLDDDKYIQIVYEEIEKVFSVEGFNSQNFIIAMEGCPRRGWEIRNVRRETCWQHTIDLCLEVARAFDLWGLDIQYGIRSALAHDTGEPFYKDTLPGEDNENDKISGEQMGFEKLMRYCGENQILRGSFEAYIDQKTEEDRLVKELDKYVAIREAMHRGGEAIYEDFRRHSEDKQDISHSDILRMRQEVPQKFLRLLDDYQI